MFDRPPPRHVQSWRDAEDNAAAWMRFWGYADAVVTPGGPDGGIDVRSARALGQVKYQAVQVGRPDLQRLVGARGRDTNAALFFFTGSSYSASAAVYAEEMDIALFVYALDGTMAPVTAAARRLSAFRAAGHAQAASGHPSQTAFRRTESTPRQQGGCLIGVGLFCLWGLIAGLLNGENFDELSDIVPVLVFTPLLSLGAFFALRGGIRRLRRPKAPDGRQS